jgi:four helix bundle protein
MTSSELYDRLLDFAKQTLVYIKKLPNTSFNREYSSQLIRSSASPGANYIEALEASSRKDFLHKLKICRKETKESVHWLELIEHANPNSFLSNENHSLISEARQLIRIFTATILTTEKNQKLKKYENGK